MQIIIIGGGFGGLRLARKLSNKKGMDVTLIDRYNYHQFQPLFYQVATAGLDASNISFPFRKVFQKAANVRFLMTVVQSIDQGSNKVITANGVFYFDKLVIATGAETNFFGNEILKANAFPMKSTVDALQIRNRLLQNFEDAVLLNDKKAQEPLMNIIVVGAGPTGVELSGAIADMKKYVLPKDYPQLDFRNMKIFLLEGSDKTLGAMSEKSSRESQRYLEHLGVTVITGALLKEYDGHKAILQDGTVILSSLLIWAAGIKGNIPEGINPNQNAKGNRIKTDRYGRVLHCENIYAIGDVACAEEPFWPNGHPQVAPVAMQQADLLAENFKKELKSPGSYKPVQFTYKDKGSMATVGRNLAVVDVPKPKMHFKGFTAWLIWMTLHLMLILGVKNRFFVFVNWFYSYFTRDQNLRLIFRHPAQKK